MDIKAVSKVVMKVKSRVLFLKRADGDWELPGGHLNKGETYQRGAVREVFEETGIMLRKLKLILSEKNFHLFVTKPKITKVTLSDEHVDHVWIKSKDIPKLKLSKATKKNIKTIIKAI